MVASVHCLCAMLLALALPTALVASPLRMAAPARPRCAAPRAVDDKTEVREYFNTEGFNR